MVYGEERCFKMCVLPLASTGTSPPAFCLNWVQNDNEGSEQAAFFWFSGEWSKSYSGLLWATNWNSKSLCHLSLKAVFGRRVRDSIDRLWSPAYGETRWVKMLVQVLFFFKSGIQLKQPAIVKKNAFHILFLDISLWWIALSETAALPLVCSLTMES